MKNDLLWGGLVAIALTTSCNATKHMAQKTDAKPAVEQRDLPELEVTAKPLTPKVDTADDTYTLPVYRASYTRTHDLLHTKLDLRFDWQKQHCIGKAQLDFTPLIYTSDKLRLDAKGMDIQKVSMNGKDLRFDYENKEELFIQLDRPYKKGEKFTLAIDYTAKPNERKTGGSAAITSDKGLYFINPLGNEGDKPMQIWTQGETESNSVWFPTIDKPNERCTEDISITVEDKYKVLSNGTLVSSKKNPDGTRTDNFKMDLPHAPYLFMMAIGEFSVTKDSWQGIPLEYWVEPKFAPYAKQIFNHTPEMLSFFSDKLGVKYPWPKYSQVIVRDYVSGAMENTTAVIFGDFVQKNERELMDANNDLIVAHEMFHHWFGDLVTCESWSNLTLNEGFANYSEYLWLEHLKGRDAADEHWMEEVSGYFGQVAQSGAHPLIEFGYDKREDVFDAHSYNKGGAVLHMLRNYVGDEAFWAALNLYLTRNKFSDVEAHELRLAFEDVTGQDLNWFFNQWYFSEGHPIVNVTYDYDDSKKVASVTIEQVQDPKDFPAIFIMPLAVDIYTGEGQQPRREKITLNQRKQTFNFDVASKPSLINIDADRVSLWEKNEDKSDEAYDFQFKHCPRFMDKMEALKALADSESPLLPSLLAIGLNDKSEVIRTICAQELDISANEGLAQKLVDIAKNDSAPGVKVAAIDKLGETKLGKYLPVLKSLISDKQSYGVVGASLSAIAKIAPDEAIPYAAKLENETNDNILIAISDIYAQNPKAEQLPFFEKNIQNMQGFGVFNLAENYTTVLAKMDDAAISKAVGTLRTLGLNQDQPQFWKRFMAAKIINGLRTNYRSQGKNDKVTELSRVIEEIKSAETNSRMKGMYLSLQ
jgi:aminopeptidase N